MSNDAYIDTYDRDLEDAAAYEAEQHRYSKCLEAYTECAQKGVSNETLCTILFEMGIDKNDAYKILHLVLSSKFLNMKESA